MSKSMKIRSRNYARKVMQQTQKTIQNGIQKGTNTIQKTLTDRRRKITEKGSGKEQPE